MTLPSTAVETAIDSFRLSCCRTATANQSRLQSSTTLQSGCREERADTDLERTEI